MATLHVTQGMQIVPNSKTRELFAIVRELLSGNLHKTPHPSDTPRHELQAAEQDIQILEREIIAALVDKLESTGNDVDVIRREELSLAHTAQEVEEVVRGHLSLVEVQELGDLRDCELLIPSEVAGQHREVFRGKEFGMNHGWGGEEGDL